MSNSTLAAIKKAPVSVVSHPVWQRASAGHTCTTCSAEAISRFDDELLQRKAIDSAQSTPTVPPIVHEVLQSPGQSLDAPTRSFFEPRFGTDFSAVRVHTDAKAAESARAVNALAYTVGQNVVFGPGEYAPHTPAGQTLIAHELTHTIQQGSQPRSFQRKVGISLPGDASEHEAEFASQAIMRGQSVTVTRGIPFRIARQVQTSTAPKQGFLEHVSTAVEGVAESVADIGWKALERFAPDLVPLVRQGPIEWVKEQITPAIEAAFDTLMAPVRAGRTLAADLQAHFANLLTWMRGAAAKLAKGDCSSLVEAAEKIQQVVEGLAAPVVDRVKQLASNIKDFFTGLWDRFGAPAWEFLKSVGGAAWEKIQQLGSWLGQKIARVREIGGQAWTWIKGKLGIGEGPEGQDGLMQWLKSKIETIWDERIKPFVERYKKPLLVVGGTLAMLSPAGPFLAIGAAAGGLIMGLRWIRQHWNTPNGLVDGRDILQKTILPGILGAVKQISTWLSEKAQFIASKLSEVLGGLGQTVSIVAGSLFRFAVSALQWITDRFSELASWAREKLMALATWVGDGLERLHVWLEPVLGVLRRIGEVALDILKLPGLVLSGLWNKIPACIRDPFVRFLTDLVVKRIKLFQQISALAEVWDKIKAAALTLIHKIFVDGDLPGALLIVLRLALNALDVPLELVTGIFTKGAAAIHLILDDPIGFLRNTLAALWEGFSLYFANIGSHLLNGVIGWLFNAVSQAGLRPPTLPLTLTSVFEFILQVLDITVERILQRLEKKIGPEKVAPIRKAISILSKLWDWFNTLLNEGPEGVWNRLKEQLGDLWSGLLNGMVDWMIKKVVKAAIPKITAMLAGGPIGAIINGLVAIYKAAKAFARELKRILGIISSVLDGIADIAHGNIMVAANILVKALDGAMSVAIGFLADQLGLGDLGERIQEMVEFIREKVNTAIDWLIDKALAIGGALLGLAKAGIGKLAEWWKEKETFEVNGQKHTIEFQGEDAEAELVVESTPQVLESYLASANLSEDTKNKVMVHKIKIDDLKKKTDGGFGQAAGETIKQELLAIASNLGMVMPESVITLNPQKRGPFHDAIGWEMTAKPLSLKPGNTVGSQPYEESDLWMAVKRRQGAYVRGHLLNHHMHGPGSKNNLVPIPGSTNTQMERDYEDEIKRLVLSEAKVVEYTVEAEFERPSGQRKNLPEEDYLPSALIFNASILDENLQPIGNPIFKDSRLEVKLPDDTPVDAAPPAVVNLSTAKAEELQTIPGIDEVRAKRIIELREKKGQDRFYSYDDLLDAGIIQEMVAQMREKSWVKLF